MRAIFQDGSLLRIFAKNYGGEIAYVKFGLSGLRATIEFPSDWHEHRRGWVILGFGLFRLAFSFPWRWTVPDQGQCSGPTYGFYFFEDALVLKYGKDTGRRGDPTTFIYLPWAWEHIRHDYLNPNGSLHHRAGSAEYSAPASTKRVYPFSYVLRNGTVQQRSATINGEEREWRWKWFRWLPWPNKIIRSINIEFDGEVGERSGSWKGGTIGCSYNWKGGESMRQALARMEREREFS